ncbi:TetR/AcrR family transcriptional regulator [Alloyangia pacifica]|uniref:Transcriptional regulator, TetR family n=1 Tax=Alloyangia pacifica TaxID=311180 RepID=A0A1I6SDV5_9RHOB|nr:TetR/AcrR family transcriptional regulator [Alloyangia pacifica]SDG76805.1 transcriptional regulator, TetR family [Alloyangia pacifica]SFS75104.1 transcriptional regulator, TetR family [Alloyangia pacifica]
MTEKRASIGARRNPDTEAAVLNAATQILAEAGIAGLRMEAVAKRARAGKATLYRWWPTRGALLLAVYRRMKTEDVYADTGSLEGDIAGVLRLVFGHWRRETGAVFRSIIAAAQVEPDVAEALAEFRLERRTALLAVIARAERRGELPAGLVPERLAEAVIATLWFKLLSHDLDDDPDALARVLTQSWSKG